MHFYRLWNSLKFITRLTNKFLNILRLYLFILLISHRWMRGATYLLIIWNPSQILQMQICSAVKTYLIFLSCIIWLCNCVIVGDPNITIAWLWPSTYWITASCNRKIVFFLLNSICLKSLMSRNEFLL